MTDFFEAGKPAASPIRRRVWDVFISYSRRDATIATDLAAELEGRGFDTWIDTKLKAGEPLRAIDDALQASAAVIVLISKTALSSKSLTREVEAAFRALPAERVFPVAVGELDVRQLPPWLANRSYLHLRDRRNVEKLVDRLLPDLSRAAGDVSDRANLARVSGTLPARVAVIGVDSYLRELLAAATGVTWIVGMAGTGKTTIAREFAYRVRDSVAALIWLEASGHSARELVEQLALVSAEQAAGIQTPSLIIVDGLDGVTDHPAQFLQRLAELGDSHRVLITTRRLSDTWLMQPQQYSIVTVGRLTQAAVADYLAVHFPHMRTEERAQLAQVVDAAGGSPLVLRLLTQALKTTPLQDLLSPASAPEETFGRFMRAALRSLPLQQRARLNTLAFCTGLLTIIRSNKRWRLPGDDDLFVRLLDWGLFSGSADGSISAHPLVVGFIRQDAPREALESAVEYVRERLPDPEDAASRELLPSIVELTEMAELDWSPSVSAGLAELLIWQASVWRSAGEHDRAELLSPRVLELALEAGEPLLQIRAMNLQSALAFDGGRLREASEIERRTVEIASTRFGPKHPLTTATLGNLAVSLRALGDLPSAITLLRRVVEQNQDALPRDHPDLIASQVNLALCLREAGLATDGLALLTGALEHVADAQLYVRVAQIRAATLADLDRTEEALEVLESCLARAERNLPPAAPEVLTALASLAMVLARQRRFHEALEIQSEVVDRSELTLGPDHPSTLSAQSNRAVLLAELGESSEALQQLLLVAENRARLFGPDHPDALHSRLLAARALGQAGDHRRALAEYSDLIGPMVRTFGPENAMTLTVREEHSQQLLRLGDVTSARLAYRELLADLDRVLPRDHPMVRRVRAAVSDLGR